MLTVYDQYLYGDERLTAEYLSAVSDYRRLSAEFATMLERDGEANMALLDAASKRLAAIENNDAFIRAQMLPLAEAAVRLGYSHQQVARICRSHGPEGSRQVRAERRHGKLWYVYVPDVEYLIGSGELRGPYFNGKKASG